MSSFAALVYDLPYNILLFDARGHNESNGTFLTYTDLKNYGTVEYRDILAAMEFVQTYSHTHHLPADIILYGICSGAFHTIRAYEYLEKSNIQDQYHIKGIIFDSGWLHIHDIAHPTIAAEVQKMFQNKCL